MRQSLVAPPFYADHCIFSALEIERMNLAGSLKRSDNSETPILVEHPEEHPARNIESSYGPPHVPTFQGWSSDDLPFPAVSDSKSEVVVYVYPLEQP